MPFCRASLQSNSTTTSATCDMNEALKEAERAEEVLGPRPTRVLPPQPCIRTAELGGEAAGLEGPKTSQAQLAEERQQRPTPDYCFCCGLHLTTQEKERLLNLLGEIVGIFAAKEEDCTSTGLVQHHFDTGDATPIRMRPHRLPQLSSTLFI